MARKKKRRRRTRTIPVAPLAGFIGGLLAPKYGGTGIIDHIKRGQFDHALKDASVLTTGFDPNSGKWNPMKATALQGLFAGLIVHKVANMLGQGQVFSRLPAPLNKIRI